MSMFLAALGKTTRKTGIKRKLLLSYLAIIIPLIIVILFAHYGRYQDKREEVMTSRLVYARVVASDVEHFVEEMVNTERVVGLAIRDNNYTRRRASEYLSKLASSYPLFDLNYVRLDGEIYASSNPQLVGRKIKHNQYDIEPLREEREWLASNLHLHENGEMGFDIVSAVRKDGELAGTVVASVDVNRLNEFFTLDVPGGGYNITDTNGMVVYQSQKQKLPLQSRDWKSHEFIQESLKGREYSSLGLIFPVDGTYRMGAQVPVHSLGWSAGSFVPVEQVLGPIRADVMQSATIGAITAMLAVFLGLWIGGNIVRSITALADKAKAIAGGDFGEDVTTVKTGDEIEALATSFNTMQVSMRDYVSELSGIVQAGETMNLALNVPFVEGAVVNALRNYFGAEAVWVAFYDDKEKRLVVDHFWSDRNVDFKGLSVGPGQGIAGSVLMTGKPVVTQDLASSDFAYKDLALEVGIDAAITLPLISGGGPLGVVGLYTPLITHNRITDKEMGLLMALANQAAVAIENARLYEEMRESERKLRASNDDLRILNKIALDVSSGLDLAELAKKIINNAVDLVGADFGSIGIYDDESGKMAYRYKTNMAPDLPVLEMPDDFGLAETVVKERRPVYTNDYRHDPRALREALYLGINAVAVVPILMSNRLTGVIKVASTGDKAFRDSDIALLEAVARQAAVAIENAHLYEREREVAEALQNALLAVPDRIAGVRFGLLYRAATERSKVSGDFYDFIEFTNGKIGVVVGDVSGKGLEAATATALAKMTIRAFAYEYESPGEVLRHANSVLASQMAQGQFITIAYLVLDPVTGKFSYASAGHPPPLVANHAAWSARQLAIGSVPLGVVEGAAYESYTDGLARDEMILLYTDGLLEARSDGTLFGADGITTAMLAHGSAGVEAIPHELLQAAEAFAKGKLSDDIAIIALSLDGSDRKAAAPEEGTQDGYISDWVI